MQKLFTIVLGILLFSSIQLNAAYLTNIPKTITQPDGLVINCFTSGDEFHNWLHDENNYTIIQAQDGYYYYATKDGNKIIPSKYKVGTASLKSNTLQPGINISAKQWKQKRKSKYFKTPSKSFNLKDGTAEVNINQLCIYIRFNDDDEWTKDTSMYYDWLNNEDPEAISMINYYKEVSYGKVEVHSHFYPRSLTDTVVSYKDTQDRGFFEPYNETTNPIGYDPDEDDWANENSQAKREWDLLGRVVDYFNANHSVPENIDLDYDDDGYMDNIEFFVAGVQGDWNDLLWPHNWAIQDRQLTINGIKIFNYNFQIEAITDARGVGVLSHEMGHALGYPDLYQYADESTYDPVGPWDIMATTASVPQSFGAFTKFKYGGWISNIEEITTAGVYTLNPIDSLSNNCYKIASPYSTTEYFVLEYRKKAGRFESSVPGSGLLIYRINTSAGNGNADGPPDEIYIYRPDGTLTDNGKIYQANFSADAGRKEINNTTNPSPFLNNGGIGGLYISEVSAANETISFRVDFYPDALYPDFSADDQKIYAWKTINFTDLSVGSPDTWEWTFEGGNPSTFNGENPPPIQYSSLGIYDVELKVTKGDESITETRPDYIIVTTLPGTNPPKNLTAETQAGMANTISLKWDEPFNGIQTFPLQWDDGENNNSVGSGDSTDSFDALSHWKPDELLPYDGMYITKISFYPDSSAPATVNDYTLKIYTGSDLSNLAVDQAIPPEDITFDRWNSFELTTPFLIDASVDLWFGANNNSGTEPSGFPFGIDKGPAITGKGDVIYYAEGDSIFYLKDFGLDNNWNLKATVVNRLEETSQKSYEITRTKSTNYKSMDGYNVYRNGIKINNTVVSLNKYIDSDVPPGDYNYFITATYTSGESIASNVANITIEDNVGIPQVEIKEFLIYPNPVKDNLVVQLEEQSDEPLSIQIFDHQGKLVYSREISPISDKIEIAVNNLSNGAYVLLMYNTEKAFHGKFVVLN